jgi:hypothetical protein
LNGWCFHSWFLPWFEVFHGWVLCSMADFFIAGFSLGWKLAQWSKGWVFWAFWICRCVWQNQSRQEGLIQSSSQIFVIFILLILDVPCFSLDKNGQKLEFFLSCSF